jgi:hypothetical protein
VAGGPDGSDGSAAACPRGAGTGAARCATLARLQALDLACERDLVERQRARSLLDQEARGDRILGRGRKARARTQRFLARARVAPGEEADRRRRGRNGAFPRRASAARAHERVRIFPGGQAHDARREVRDDRGHERLLRRRLARRVAVEHEQNVRHVAAEQPALIDRERGPRGRDDLPDARLRGRGDVIALDQHGFVLRLERRARAIETEQELPFAMTGVSGG